MITSAILYLFLGMLYASQRVEVQMTQTPVEVFVVYFSVILCWPLFLINEME